MTEQGASPQTPEQTESSIPHSSDTSSQSTSAMAALLRQQLREDLTFLPESKMILNQMLSLIANLGTKLQGTIAREEQVHQYLANQVHVLSKRHDELQQAVEAEAHR